MKRSYSLGNRVCFDPDVQEKSSSLSKEYTSLTLQQVLELKDIFELQVKNGEGTIPVDDLKKLFPMMGESISDEQLAAIKSRFTDVNAHMFLLMMNKMYDHNKKKRSEKKEAVRQYRESLIAKANCELQSCIPICMCALDLSYSASSPPSAKKVSFEEQDREQKKSEKIQWTTLQLR